MLDDFRLEWLCRRTCQMLNIDRSIFIDMLDQKNGSNEDLIDRFFTMNTTLHERSYALVFYREDSKRDVWQMIETIDTEDLDDFNDDNDEEEKSPPLMLTANHPINTETEYSTDYVLNHARLSSDDAIDVSYEDIKHIQRLLVINQYDNKNYYFELKSYHQIYLYCQYYHYSNLTEKTFVYFVRIDMNQYFMQSSTFNEMNLIMNENIIYGIIPEEQPFDSLIDILSFIYNNTLPLTQEQSHQNGFISSPNEDLSQRDRLKSTLNRFRLHIASTLRQMQGEFNLIIPNKNILINGDETDEEYIENLEYIIYHWERLLQEEMNNELNRKVSSLNPRGELEFWHERSIRLTSILEQMKKDDVLKIVHILTDVDSSSLLGFNNIKLQLQSYLLEATDNYKFLLTIERHLKTLEMTNSFETIVHMLPNLMQGLKTIWNVVSQFYATTDDDLFRRFIELQLSHLILVNKFSIWYISIIP